MTNEGEIKKEEEEETEKKDSPFFSPPGGEARQEQLRDFKLKLSMLNDADKLDALKTGCLNSALTCLLDETGKESFGDVFADEMNLAVNDKIKTRLMGLFKPKRATQPRSVLGKKWKKLRKKLKAIV